jgi:hypothetical protein
VNSAETLVLVVFVVVLPPSGAELRRRPFAMRIEVGQDLPQIVLDHHNRLTPLQGRLR